MPAIRLCVLFVYIASASSETFHYSKLKPFEEYRRTYEEDCTMCYADDCLSMTQARCHYYTEAADILDNEELDHSQHEINVGMKTQVDNMLYDVLENVKTIGYNCLPLISKYTNCTNENICTGCSVCYCNSMGSWNCSTVQQCRTDPSVVDLNHRVLMTVMLNLKNDVIIHKVKRSANEDTQRSVNYTRNNETQKWVYNMKSFPINENNMTTKMKVFTETTTALNTEANTKSDIEYLAFEEVLNNIGYDSKTKRKQLDCNHETNLDNVSIDDEYVNITFDDISNALSFKNSSNTEEVTAGTTEGDSKVIIDLLETLRNNSKLITDPYQEDFIDNIKNKETHLDIDNDLENNSNKLELIATRFMKRDVSIVNNNVMLKTDNLSNALTSVHDLKNNALKPLLSIIIEKEKELDELLKIKNELLAYIKKFQSEENLLPYIYDVTTEDRYIDSHVSVNKVEILPQLQMDTRRTYRTFLEKYLHKLKKDIYEVMKGVGNIHKYSPIPLSQHLKVLIRAMKYYIHNADHMEMRKKPKYYPFTNKTSQIYRRYGEPQSSIKEYMKDAIIKIFEAIDKDMPQSNALDPLSHYAKKIMRRIVKQYYIDEFEVIGLRVDPHYNLTNDLKSVGTKWQQMTTDIVSSHPANRLYNMKLLHLVLCKDINKMTDALALIDFAQSRRIMPIEQNIGEEIMLKINKDLQTITNRIGKVIDHYRDNEQNVKVLNDLRNEKQQKKENSNTKKKESFMKKIKDLLRSSKKDLLTLIQNKVPKSKIVKYLAQKKLDEINKKKLSEYQQTMQKWQKNLNIVRRRRSVREYKSNKNRIKNIIPIYLRGKLNPAIKAKNVKKKQE